MYLKNMLMHWTIKIVWNFQRRSKILSDGTFFGGTNSGIGTKKVWYRHVLLGTAVLSRRLYNHNNNRNS